MMQEYLFVLQMNPMMCMYNIPPSYLQNKPVEIDNRLTNLAQFLFEMSALEPHVKWSNNLTTEFPTYSSDEYDRKVMSRKLIQHFEYELNAVIDAIREYHDDAIAQDCWVRFVTEVAKTRYRNEWLLVKYYAKKHRRKSK